MTMTSCKCNKTIYSSVLLTFYLRFMVVCYSQTDQIITCGSLHTGTITSNNDIHNYTFNITSTQSGTLKRLIERINDKYISRIVPNCVAFRSSTGTCSTTTNEIWNIDIITPGIYTIGVGPYPVGNHTGIYKYHNGQLCNNTN